MIENWKDVQIVPEFCDQGVDCYRLEGGHFLNEYYIVSEAETRKLMNHPEVVGYEVYASLVTATSQPTTSGWFISFRVSASETM